LPRPRDSVAGTRLDKKLAWHVDHKDWMGRGESGSLTPKHRLDTRAHNGSRASRRGGALTVGDHEDKDRC
jgi:hypothetical protein